MMNSATAGRAVTVGTGLAAAAAAVGIGLHPHAVRGVNGMVLIAGTVVLFAAYLWYAVRVTRHPETGQVMALWFGVVAATCWAAEIWAGGPARFSPHIERVVGATFAVAATAITLTAGVIAGTRARHPRPVWRAGIVAGAASGCLVYLFAVVMTLYTLPTLGARADYQAQYATTTFPTMSDFLVDDILGAAAAHLVINVGLGLLGAVLGRIVYAVRRHRPAAASA